MNIFRTRTRRGAALLCSGVLVLALAGEATACEDVGQLVVTKVVVGTDNAVDHTFEFCVIPVGGGEQRCEYVVGNGSVTFGDLPVGEYVLTETDPPPNFSVEGSGVTVTVETEDTTRAVVTNTWIPPAEEFGRVEVTKAVTGDGAPTNDNYEICLTGPDPSTTTSCKNVVGAGTVPFEDLVPGIYTVTETDPGTEYDVTITPAAVEVTLGGLATATVTNTWIPPAEEFGRVEVTKAVSGEGAPTNDNFEICLTGPDPSTTTSCKNVVGAGLVTFGDLVAGVYTVTETNPGTGYAVTITPATVEVTVGGVATAVVANAYTKQESLPPTVPVTPEVLPPTVPVTPEVLPPTVPVTPEVLPPVTPTAAAPVPVLADQAALPNTGSEGGIAAIATILVAAGVVLAFLGRRREPQQA